MDYHVIVLVLVALYWIGVGIYRFFQWIARSAAKVAGGPAPMQQALEEARRQAQVQKVMRPQAAPQRPQAVQQPAYPRQPEAGGPAVPWEATSQDFQRQEMELLTEEPTALNVALQSSLPQADAASFPLFQTSDDLVRAIILQEVLGPPLSHKSSRTRH